MDIATIFIRFAIVFLLSLLFGIQRQRSHKPTGFGPFIFVSVGSCALAIIATTIQTDNPLPLLGSIVTGIGFLGAGALVKTTDKIFGFTTAASIWVFAIFGLIIGVGQYYEGTILYALIWLVVLFDNYFEKKGVGLYQRKMVITTSTIIGTKEIDKILPRNRVLAIEMNKDTEKMVITYLIEGSKDELNHLPKTLYTQEWFESCKLE